MKKVFSKINFGELAGNMAGGVVASMADEYIPDILKDEAGNGTDANDYLKIGIMAIGGALISSMSKNSIVRGTGTGMVAFAGANLYDKLTADKTTVTGIRRIGLLPSQKAVGLLPSQNAVGAARWIKNKSAKKVASVQ